MGHHEIPSKASSSKKGQRTQAVQPTPVPNLDVVQALMPEPDFLFPPELEPPKAVLESSFREQVKYAIANNWKYDPIGCSAKAAVKVAQDRLPITKEEYCRITKEKLNRVKKVRNLPWLDYERSRKQYEWLKNTDVDDVIFNLHCANLDQELDEFYGSDGTDLRPIHNEADDEGFSEPDTIATTVVSLPDKSLLEEGVTPGGIFQDSGIVMDGGYAEYSLAHSRPNTATLSAGMIPSDWPVFHAIVTALPSKKRGPRLALVGDQEQTDWPGRRQGPYNLDGLRWVRASKEASASHDVEVCVGKIVDTADARRDADQIMDVPIVESTPEAPLPAETTSSIESMERAQRISESSERNNDDKPFEATPELLDQEHLHALPENNKSDEQAVIQETSDEVPITNKEQANTKASEAVPHLVSEERPQHLDGSNEGGHENESSIIAPGTVQAIPQFDMNTDVDASHNIFSTAITTPVNQRIQQIEQVRVDTPATPATININFTPEYNSDLDADDTSDGSLEVRLPSSPTANTQKGQSALGRYVQETTSLPNLAHQSSSTISIAGSASEEVSLVPTHEHPSQSEGHAGFTKGVQLHQKKSDAVFTLSSPKASQATPSSGKAAPTPVTPANETDSASFRPTTPFQLGTPAQNRDFDSPGTPTPAPKEGKASGKSVRTIFKSAKLGSRSPERAKPSPDIVVAPTLPVAGITDQYRGSHGLLFNNANKNEKGTRNVLNSLKLNPGQESGGIVREGLDNSEDELASDPGVEVYKVGKWTPETRGARSSKSDRGASGARNVAQAVVVPSVRRRHVDEVMQIEDVQTEEPKKKKPRRSTRTNAGGVDVPDVGPFFEH